MMDWINFLDKCIKELSDKLTPAIWVVIIIGLLVYAAKELMAYNKNNNASKSEVHDKLDNKTFQNAVIPLLSDFNAQLMTSTLSNLSLNGDEKPAKIISLYEQEKIKSATSADLSTLESSISLTDTLDSMSISRNKRRSYDGHYSRARICLWIGTIGLSIQLLVGLSLIISHSVFEDVVLSRVLFVIWLILLIINVTASILYVIDKTKVDGFIDED